MRLSLGTCCGGFVTRIWKELGALTLAHMRIVQGDSNTRSVIPIMRTVKGTLKLATPEVDSGTEASSWNLGGVLY